MDLRAAGYSAETRPLPLKRRLDLEVHEVHFGGSRYWHVKDPISLRYYQLKPEEYAVLMQLDGHVSLRDIRRQFEDQFAPQRLDASQLQSFLAVLHGAGLIMTDSPAQAEFVLRRQYDEQRQRWLNALSSVLAIRFRGFDPHAFLNWLTPLASWLFRPVGGTLALTFILVSVLFAALNVDALQMRLPRFHEFFSGSNLFVLAATLGLTKVLHELGHAVSCRRFGAECHEMGLMLLVGTPCLYCNVSDAWMLPNRRQRIVISSAGMYVELLLASAALWLWWWSVPGFFNSLCLNVVVVCSISTVLFNGNPLLRYDGYYILSDVLEIPNLRQQAGTLVANTVGNWLFDTDIASPRLMPEQRQTLLTVWFIASGVYRLVMLWGIIWFVDSILEPYGLTPLAVVVAVLSVAGLLLTPLVQFVALLRNPFWTRTVNWPRFWLRSTLVVAALVGSVALPLPFSVQAPAVIEAEQVRHVFVQQKGRLKWTVAAEQIVAANETIAVLENVELEKERVRLTGEVSVLEQQLASLEARRARDSEVSQLIPINQERLAKKRDELTQRETDLARLTIKAPIAGRVLPPPERLQEEQSSTRHELPSWSGTPLDESNRGVTLEAGIELCQIAPADRYEAVLAIDQNDIEFISTGQRVELLLDHVADRHVSGQIVEIAEVDLSVAPRELVEHPDFPTRLGSDGVPRPVSTAYQARVRLDGDESLVLRGTGVAKVDAQSLSVADRLRRFLGRTFRFRT